MLTIFFIDVSLITLNALQFGARFNQEHFINNILFDIVEARKKFSVDFAEQDFCAYGQFHVSQ
jgi:hypothetical protein